MKMKKILFAIIPILLTSCGGNSATPQSESMDGVLKTITFGYTGNRFPTTIGNCTFVNNYGEEINAIVTKIEENITFVYQPERNIMTGTLGSSSDYCINIHIENVFKVSCPDTNPYSHTTPVSFNGTKDGKALNYIFGDSPYIDNDYKTNIDLLLLRCNASGDDSFGDIVITYLDTPTILDASLIPLE